MGERRVRLIYPPDLTREPLVYRMGHEFNIVTNIRMVDIDQNVGFVVLGLEGEDEEIERAIEWARAQGLRVDDATLGDVVEG